jgi:hypothetical protein
LVSVVVDEEEPRRTGQPANFLRRGGRRTCEHHAGAETCQQQVAPG